MNILVVPSNRVAAFKIGICLNQLRWHHTLARVTLHPFHWYCIVPLLDECAELAAQLDPEDRGGAWRVDALRYNRAWRHEYSIEGTRNEWADTWSLLNDCTTDLIGQFLPEESNFGSRLLAQLASGLKGLPQLTGLFHLGVCLDEGRHPASLLHTAEFDWSPNREGSSGSRPPHIGGRRPPNEIGDSIEPLHSATLPPEANWKDQLDVAWQYALPKLGVPALKPEDRSETSLNGWIEIQSQRIIAHLDCVPPSSGWRVRKDEGAFFFGSKSYQLQRQPLKFLEALVLSNGEPVSSAELIRHIWDVTAKAKDKSKVDSVTPGTKLAQLYSRVNIDLTKVLGIPKQKGRPICKVGTGTGSKYSLIPDLEMVKLLEESTLSAISGGNSRP